MENINLACARLKQSMNEAHLALNSELSHAQKNVEIVDSIEVQEQ